MSNNLNNGFDANDPAKIYDRLTSLTLEEIRERVHGNLLGLVAVFIVEMKSAVALDAGASDIPLKEIALGLRRAGRVQKVLMWRTWERWLPLIRKKFFVEALESEILRLKEHYAEEENYFEMIRVMARDFNQMREEDLKEYFETMKDPERERKSVTVGLAMDECYRAQDAHQKGDLVGARILFERAIDIFEDIGDEKMLAASTLELGNVLSEDGLLLESEELYRKAATIFERLGDMTNLTIALRNLARSMAKTGDLPGAYQVALRGLRIEKLGESKTETAKTADFLFRIAKNLPGSEGINYYQQIIQAFDELQLREESASAHLLMSKKLMDADRFEEACEASVKGLRLMVEAKASPEKIRWAQHTYTLIWASVGRSQRETVESVNDIFVLPADVKRLGDLYVTLTGRVQAGEITLEEAGRVLRQEHDREPFTVSAVAVLYEDLHETLKASNPPTEVLAIWEISHRLLILVTDYLGDPELGSALHFSLGIINDQRGQFKEAAQTFERGAELASLTGNTEFFITMRLNSAIALERSGDGVAAVNTVELLLKELKTFDENNLQPDDYPRICLELVQLYHAQSRVEKAEATAFDALEVVDASPPVTDPKMLVRLQRIEASLQIILGNIHKSSGRYVSAERHYQRALELGHALNDRDTIAVVHFNLGGVRLELNDMDEALRLFNLAYQQIEQLFDPAHTPLYTDRARALLDAGEEDEARKMATLALELNPTARQAAKCTVVLLHTATSDAELRDALSRAELILSSNTTPETQCITLIGLLTVEGASPEQRKEWTMRLHQLRDSFEGFQGAEIDLYITHFLSGTGTEKETAIEYLEHCLKLIDEAATDNQARDVQRHIFETGNRAAQRLLQLKAADDDSGLEIVLRAKARATLNERFTAARTVDELKTQLSSQPKPVLLVEMYTLPKETLLYFVTADGLQGVEHIAITADTLYEENLIVNKLGDFKFHEAAWYSEVWRHLSEAFARSVSHYIQPGQLVCLIPSGFWHFLPLHACLINGYPLIENHPVYYGPSSAILSCPGTLERCLQTCLSVGVEFEEEAAWVADWFGAEAALLGPLAHPHTVLRSLRKADVVHFSCHGAYNPLRGDESGVLLAYESWLTPSLMEQQTTNADLVTLSACETAFNFVTAANDMVGLDQTFLNMGAVSVLGTLWPVESEATKIFVKAFYEKLTGRRGSEVKQMSKAHAFQAAVAQLRSEPEFDRPFFWAAFKLTGGWL